MGTSIAEYLSAAEVEELKATRDRLLTASSGVPAGKFVYFAAFDGTNNDKNNLPLSGNPYQTNVATLQDQAIEAKKRNPNLGVGYYPGVGTGGDNGNWINAAVVPTSAVHHAAEVALKEFTEQARDFLRDNPTATYADLSLATVGFSRGTAPQVLFARLVDERGLVLPDGAVVAPPHSVPVTSMVMFDPVHTFIREDLSLPPNVVGKVLVLAAHDELRGEFKLADYRHDPRVLFVEVPGNHSGIGGSYDLHGTGAATLEIATGYLQHGDVPLADVPPERRFDPSQPIPKYTEVRQVARNGDALGDEYGRPMRQWSELPERGIAPLRSSAPAPARRSEHAVDEGQPNLRREPTSDRPRAFDRQRYLEVGNIPVPPTFFTEPDTTPTSSLGPVHRLERPDRAHELTLLREIALVNERTLRELAEAPVHTHVPVLPQRAAVRTQESQREAPPMESARTQAPTTLAEPAAPERDDPRHPIHCHHALYTTLQDRMPYASEERLMQFTAACHIAGITAQNFYRVIPLEATEQVWFERSWPPGPFAKVDLNAPMPTPQQAMQQVQEFDQQQMTLQAAFEPQWAQLGQQHMEGPRR